jgi:hypothetical protein
MRGSRPGERRGGRQKGTPNKKTAYVRAVMAAHAAEENISPIDLIPAVMREPHVALDQRVKMALKALPHVHATAKAGHPSKLRGAKRDNGSSNPAHMNANARIATEKVHQKLMPLDFLQSVIRDAKTPAALQIKVAQVILPYFGQSDRSGPRGRRLVPTSMALPSIANSHASYGTKWHEYYSSGGVETSVRPTRNSSCD